MAAEIRITMSATGALHVQAPVNDPALCLLLLGQAAVALAQEIAKGQAMLPLLVPGAVRPGPGVR